MKYFIIVTLALSSIAFAGPVKGPRLTGGHKSSYHWYDGNQKRKVWLNSELISEFDEVSVIKPAIQQAQPVEGEFGVTKIWKLPRTQLSTNVAQRLQAQNSKFSVSPVFHDRNVPRASMKALPGNVIVTFNPDWSESQIKNWVESYQLQIVEKLGGIKNTYLIESAAGLPSIATANRIYETGQVVSSTPNWWKEQEAK